ncbi:hypothetical protein FKM82_028302, partial [Ascaphus truei]
PPTSPPANADPQAQNPTDQPWTSTVQLQEDTQTQRALGNTSGDQQARDSPNLNSEVGNKMKNMTVAVISLLLVSLGLVATVTVLICRRKRRGGKSPSLPLITQCTASNPRYQLAPETDHT